MNLSMTNSRMTSCFLLFALFVVLSGCGKVEEFDDNHPKVVAAMEEARANVDDFVSVLEAPSADQKSFAIKVKIEDGDFVEHLWAHDVFATDEGFIARISDQPVNVKSVKKGDTINVKRDEISDWMYVDDGRLVGGFTIRVLRDMATEKERKEFDESVPFRF